MLTKIRPIEHFKELVNTAIRRQRVKTNALAEFYLSSLLNDFVFSAGKLPDEPLAITYLKALGSSKEVQARLLKQLGDVSLFTSGFFSDSLKRKIVDVDYYMAMGSASYGYLAHLHREDASGQIPLLFNELSRKFPSFVDVLIEVSETSRLTSSKDVLRIYERWLRTKSRQAERLLRDMGIEPMQVTTRPIH